VGRLFRHLEKLGLIEDTIFVFTADHGDMRGEHHRQNKGVPLEASAKVPFIIRYPSAIPRGRRVNQAINTVDFLPTMLNLMKIKSAGREDGRDCARILKTGKTPKGWRDITFLRSTSRADSDQVGWIAAVTPRYKLILSSSDEPWLLDLKQDPDELTNFIDDPRCKDIAISLARELMTYGKKFKDPYCANPVVRSHLGALSA
jgi:arylsulfatase A-like enzyme